MTDARPIVTYRATDSKARSTCSLTCKFSYVSPGVNVKHSDGKEETSEGWSKGFLEQIGQSISYFPILKVFRKTDDLVSFGSG
jgi:ribulose kinase